jgi:hypothetical protein
MPVVTFHERTVEDLEGQREGSRGRVSYPIVKGFMETGYRIAEVDLGEIKRKPFQLQQLLKSYIDTHDMPIKVAIRKNRLFMIRLDIDDAGNPIPDWQERLAAERRATVGDVEDITIDLVKGK